MQIEYTRTAVKAINRMDKAQRLRIRDAIEGLTLKPPRGDIKPMQGTPSGRYTPESGRLSRDLHLSSGWNDGNSLHFGRWNPWRYLQVKEVAHMSELAQRTAKMMDMLPEHEQTLAFEMLKRIVLAWDPDFTKLTEAEALSLQLAEDELAKGDTIPHDAINWDA